MLDTQRVVKFFVPLKNIIFLCIISKFHWKSSKNHWRKKAFVSYWRGGKIVFFFLNILLSLYHYYYFFFLPNWSLEDMEACDISAISRKRMISKNWFRTLLFKKLSLIYLFVTQCRITSLETRQIFLNSPFNSF